MPCPLLALSPYLLCALPDFEHGCQLNSRLGAGSSFYFMRRAKAQHPQQEQGAAYQGTCQSQRSAF
jgi:hypothetical protein